MRKLRFRYNILQIVFFCIILWIKVKKEYYDMVEIDNVKYIDYYKDSELFFHSNRDYPPFTHSFGMHAHEIYELQYLISGQGSIYIEGMEYPIQPSCIYLIRSNEVHYTRLTGTEPYERIILHFFPNILDSIDPKHLLLVPFDEHLLGNNNFYFLEKHSKLMIENALQNILQVSNDNYKKRITIISSLFSILTEINKLYSKNPDNSFPVSKNSLISEIIFYINEHLFEDLSVNSLCRCFYISRSSLNISFKKLTSSTVWNYITIKRLLAAKTFLYEGTPAYETALLCGFKDYSTFFRAYKQYFGTTPQKDAQKNTILFPKS